MITCELLSSFTNHLIFKHCIALLLNPCLQNYFLHQKIEFKFTHSPIFPIQKSLQTLQGLINFLKVTGNFLFSNFIVTIDLILKHEIFFITKPYNVHTKVKRTKLIWFRWSLYKLFLCSLYLNLLYGSFRKQKQVPTMFKVATWVQKREESLGKWGNIQKSDGNSLFKLLINKPIRKINK